jgi:hypothetical protein
MVRPAILLVALPTVPAHRGGIGGLWALLFAPHFAPAPEPDRNPEPEAITDVPDDEEEEEEPNRNGLTEFDIVD